MTEQKESEIRLNKFGRSFALLFNRASMYQIDHPYVKTSLDDFHLTVADLLESISPLVFHMNLEQFFVDEDPLDPRINVSRMVTHFKKTGVYSISFEKGINRNEVRTFLEVFTSVQKYPDAEIMKNILKNRGIQHVKINHVTYKKVSEDDEIISKEALKKVTPQMADDSEAKSKRAFMEMVLESVMSEEIEKALTIRNLTDNPAGLSKKMIDFDLNSYKDREAEGGIPGPALSRQLEIMEQEVKKKLDILGTRRGGASGIPMSGAAVDGAGVPGGMEDSGNGASAGEEHMGGASGGIPSASAGEGPGFIGGAGDAGGGPSGAADYPGGVSGGVPSGPGSYVGGVSAEEPSDVTTGGMGASEGRVSDQVGPEGPGDEHSGKGSAAGHQIKMIQTQIGEQFAGGESVDIVELANAVYQMKKELFEGIEAQKAMGIIYSNENEIVEKANEISDSVIIKLIRDEYKEGKISTKRMAQILKRLIPDADELKRLLPKIKTALLEEGMPLSEYLSLIGELGKELQSEDLAKILKQSSEEVGIDGDELIQSVKKDPLQAAELIYLAEEIKKGGGDEKELTNLLVDYVERMGSEMALDMAAGDEVKNEENLRQVMTGVESTIVKRLKGMDVNDNVLARLEERLNKRMDEVLDNIREQWIHSQSSGSGGYLRENLSVLQTLEQSVSESEELGKVLKIVRDKVEVGEIDENDFKQIYSEIINEKQKKLDREEKRKAPPGILKAESVLLMIEKEILRSIRYSTPFTTLAFSLINARPDSPLPKGAVTQQALMDAIVEKLSFAGRNSDIYGQMGKSQVIAILPMTTRMEARVALRRILKKVHSEPLEVNGFPITVRVAGVATEFDAEDTPNMKRFMKALSSSLADQTSRVKNIQSLM